MKTLLSQAEIGQRIAKIRKKKGLSQEELSKSLKVSRSSLVQMELGNRGVGAIELQNLSQVLGFSLDDFMSKGFSLKIERRNEEPIEPEKEEPRISVPTLSLEKFKNVLLYVLERCAGKPNVGETVIYKLLYFADFNYYELYEEHLSGAMYRKLPYGPVPKRFDSIITQMMENRQLQRVKVDYHGYPQTRYIPLEKPDLTKLRASEKEVIDKVIDQMSDWSAAMISDYSHKDMPWLATDEGQEINYNLAFYREMPYSVRVYIEEENQ